MRKYQETLAASGKGPQTSQDHLVVHLKAAQRLGRVRAEADLNFCAEIILGSCFQRAFRDKFMEPRARKTKDYSQSDSEFAKMFKLQDNCLEVGACKVCLPQLSLAHTE